MSVYEDYEWISSGTNTDLPSESCLAGYDSDCDSIYAGRSEHCGDILPCIIIPNKCTAYVAFCGRTHEKTNFNVLCKTSYGWKFARNNGNVTVNAIEMGNNLNGEKLYMGRAQYERCYKPGIVYPSNCCSIYHNHTMVKN